MYINPAHRRVRRIRGGVYAGPAEKRIKISNISWGPTHEGARPGAGPSPAPEGPWDMTDLSSKNQTLDQRGHFPSSESKNENLQAEESVFKIRFGFGSGAFLVRFPM